MIFTSLSFAVFFAILLAFFALFRGTRARFYILLAASYAFYAFWNVELVVLLFAMSFWGWALGLLVSASTDPLRRKLYVALDVVLSVGTLGYFKYANFLGASISALVGARWSVLDILLPIGISFFTFHNMSYVIDMYRRHGEVCRRLDDFMLYMAFFPQLVAGPIVRATQFLPQLKKEIRLERTNILVGGQIFLGGLVEKLLFADNLSPFVDAVYRRPLLFDTATIWLAVVSYAVQIFCDFSGYTLMALGIARVLGFVLPENFRMPYLAASVADFWRRWHMSLSFWLRDYLYIPLGGNRHGPVRTYLAIMVTMLLGGLWHGASWNFALWGGLHGSALCLHRAWRQGWPERAAALAARPLYRLLAWAVTLLFVILLWVPFRSPDFATTGVVLSRLFQPSAGIAWLHPQSIVVLGCVAVWHALYKFRPQLTGMLPFAPEIVSRFAPMLFLGLTIMILILFAPVAISPFIYFQF
jgi:alginate O-acetyltransferase complex protein AlgI